MRILSPGRNRILTPPGQGSSRLKGTGSLPLGGKDPLVGKEPDPKTHRGKDPLAWKEPDPRTNRGKDPLVWKEPDPNPSGAKILSPKKNRILIPSGQRSSPKTGSYPLRGKDPLAGKEPDPNPSGAPLSSYYFFSLLAAIVTGILCLHEVCSTATAAPTCALTVSETRVPMLLLSLYKIPPFSTSYVYCTFLKSVWKDGFLLYPIRPYQRNKVFIS